MVYIDENIDNFNLQEALQELSEQRRQQALAFKHERGRRTCVLAYLLLKRALQQEFGIDEQPIFQYGPHGKPMLLHHPDIHFNISHCQEAVACAVSRQPVGIDIESVRQYKEQVARYTMNQHELAMIIDDKHPEITFTRLWTMKEARLKLTGQGITDNMKTALNDAARYRFDTTEQLAKNYIYTLCQHNESYAF
ncbi:MAG: 4'-phosphopantetheinyl transferase superfamily protein [Prevotella sp.]|nr:4'-phosphopantetheinyl transferase superfamily protein [Prevotella sp.]